MTTDFSNEAKILAASTFKAVLSSKKKSRSSSPSAKLFKQSLFGSKIAKKRKYTCEECKLPKPHIKKEPKDKKSRQRRSAG